MHPLVIEADEMQDYPQCFPSGTFVTTRRGQVPIEKVQVGDEVLTHLNRYRPVTDVITRRAPVVHVRGQGHPGMVVSDQHPFLAMRRQQAYVIQGERAIHHDAVGEPSWVAAKDLVGTFWCSPTTFPKVKGGSIPALRRGRRPVGYVPAVEVADPATYWMAGLYLAEGSIRDNAITFSIHVDEAEEVVQRLTALGLTVRGPYVVAGTLGVNVVVRSGELAQWLSTHFGRGSHEKALPTWALGLPAPARRQLLDGLIYGDGFFDPDERYAEGRMKLTTVSRALAISARLLALSLGYSASFYWVDTSQLSSFGDGFYQVVMNAGGQGYVFDHKRYTGVRDVQDLGREEDLWDLTVADDHSFVAEGIVVHNSGWVEIIETMKAGSKGAQWRCHGVSRGVRDMYYKMTTGENPDLPFKVHRFMAPHRPSWSDSERRSKIALYGGTEDNVDYRRNIFGEHGDAHNPLFVLARLMGCVRVNETAWATLYNEDVYCKLKINDELLRKSGLPIESFIDLPAGHLSDDYVSYWAGADIGFTNDPTEILVCGVQPRRGKPDVVRLLTRIQLNRIAAPDQAKVFAAVFAHYGRRMRRFGMDKTGNGLPLWQHLRTDPAIESRIAGYGFSQKVAVEFDDRAPVGNEKASDLVIEKNIVDYATDELRKLVDLGYADGSFELPYDVELLSELQGQAIARGADMGSGAAYSPRRYTGGSCHTLDAFRMLVAARSLQAIEATLAAPVARGPVLEVFMDGF